jgi:hypothetical protein
MSGNTANYGNIANSIGGSSPELLGDAGGNAFELNLPPEGANPVQLGDAGVNAGTGGGLLNSSLPTTGSSTLDRLLTNKALSSILGGGSSTGTGNMATTDNNAALSSLLGGLLGGAGNLMQGNTNVEARQAQADALRAAGQTAAASSQFRPVGTTTTFGTSNFQIDPTTGQLTSAGYQLSPQLQAYQDQIMGSNRQSLTDATNLQNLGRGYIAQSPEAAAQQWMQGQQALLQPGRDVESARLANNLQQTGRTGVSVAQGGNLGMANPEQQALANARMMQDLNLASQAQAQGRAQTTFGQGLLTGAYDPFNAGLKTATGVEALGQQPFTMSSDLATKSAASGANAGRLGLSANMAAADAMLPANQYNPYASLLSGAAGNNQLTSAAGNLFGNTALGSSLGNYLASLSGNNLNNAASNFITANPDIIPSSTFSGGGADMLNPDLRALLGL